MGNTNSIKKAVHRTLGAFAVTLAFMSAAETASAQEILLTGPLAGAPAVRKLRLYRKQRLEVSPAVSFSLLDEYQRTIYFGARVNYNLTDWFAVGVYGAFGAVKVTTSLTDETQAVNDKRRRADPNGNTLDRKLTAVNMGPDLAEQLAGVDWMLAPQLTAVPFRGKLSLFQNVHLDTDLYFFGGPAFVGISERKDCNLGQCGGAFEKASRVAVAPTFGLGFSFYVNKWNAIGFEWRGLPFAWNPAGFDTRGTGQDERFPDNKIDDKDRQFKFNQMLTLSYNFYFPRVHKVGE